MRCSLERFDGARVIEMNERVELLRQERARVVALALSFRQVEDANKTFEPRCAERSFLPGVIAQIDVQPVEAGRM